MSQINFIQVTFHAYNDYLNKLTGSFEIILYVDKNLEMGDKWGVTNAGLIDNAKEVDFSSFNTNIHRVSTSVTYKMDD